MTDQKMHLIAVIKVHEEYRSYDSPDVIVDSISEWEEVTSDELSLLKNYFMCYDYRIIEKFPIQKDIIRQGIRVALQEAQEEKRKQDEANAKKASAALARKQTREQRAADRERKQLKALLEKHGKDIDTA